MKSKRVIQYMAVFLVALIVLPHFVSATTYETVTEQINIQPEGDVDEKWNMLNETSRTNEETWNPRPEGVFVGGVVPESLFQTNVIAGEHAHLVLLNEFEFQSNYMMSGSSEFVVRLPVHTESNSWIDGYFNIYSLDDDTTYKVDYRSLYNVVVYFTGDAQMVYSSHIYSNDTEITSDYDNYYTMDERTYVMVKCPIVPGQRYLFEANLEYEQDNPPKWYFSSSDVASDGHTKSTITIYYQEAPDQKYLDTNTIDVDLGWSFVFQKGFGNTISGINKYFNKNDALYFYSYVPSSKTFTNKVVNLMIPFFSDSENISMEVRVWDTVAALNLVINVTDDFTDFILLNSSVMSHSSGDDQDNWWIVKIRFNESVRIKFPMFDLKDKDQKIQFSTAPNYNNQADENDMEYFEICSEGYYPDLDNDWSGRYDRVWFMLMHSLRIDNTTWQQVTLELPILETSGTEGDMGNKIWIDLLAIGLVVAGGVLIVSSVITGGATAVPGVMLITSGVLVWIGNNKEFIRESAIGTYVRNLLTSVWNTLVGIGKWLWQIGEMIVGAITWIVEQIIYYGAILLAIVITGLAAIVPMMIWGFEALMLTFFLKLAQGKPEEAGALAARVGGMISGAAGKMRLR
jgi:hypothetical protein